MTLGVTAREGMLILPEDDEPQARKIRGSGMRGRAEERMYWKKQKLVKEVMQTRLNAGAERYNGRIRG